MSWFTCSLTFSAGADFWQSFSGLVDGRSKRSRQAVAVSRLAVAPRHGFRLLNGLILILGVVLMDIDFGRLYLVSLCGPNGVVRSEVSSWAYSAQDAVDEVRLKHPGLFVCQVSMVVSDWS